MAFDLDVLRTRLAGAPLLAPWPTPLAVAVVADLFRRAAVAPPDDALWERWLARRPRLAEQLGVLAWMLVSSELGAQTQPLLPRCRDVAAALNGFFDAIDPLTAEMMRSNRFREEETLRKWIDAWGGSIAGEGPARSRAKLVKLDYRRTLAEYAKAEKDREKEAERRAQLLKEAQEREAAARGWRE